MGSGCSTAVATTCKSAPLEPNPDGQLKPAQNIIQRLRDKKRLLVAVQNNDQLKVKELVHRMPLEQINYVPTEKGFLDCSKNPGRRCDCALLIAAKRHHAGIVSTLLEYGALPDLTNEAGESALVVACDGNDVAIATDLLAHNANPNIPSPDGSFPLHIASSNLCSEIAKALVEHGADVNLRESGTMNTPLHITVLVPGAETEAHMHAAVEIATIIIDSERVDFTVRDARQDTALLKATKKANTELLAAFVDAGASTNLLDATGQAALHLAIAMGDKPGTTMALRLARAEQTDVNLLSKLGLSPLLMAVRGVLGEVVGALLARGADPNVLSHPGKEAPLHTALLQVPKELAARLQQKRQAAAQADEPTPSEAIAVAILSSGRADVNLQDGAARRPVFLAVTCCCTLVLSKLIEAKADLTVRDGDGHTPALKAVLLAVQAPGEKDKAADGLAAAERRAGMVIKAAPNISATGGPLHNSALHCVVSVGTGSAVLFAQLLEQKADINVLNKEGDSPLHAAICSIGSTVRHAQDAAVKMIKSGRAQTDLRNASQDTALTLAAARHAAAVMGELLGAGADVNAANNAGDTAAHLACRSIGGGDAGGGGAKARSWGPDAAQALLRSSALKLDLANGEGQTALAVLAASARWFEGAVGVAGAMVAQSTCTLNNLDKRGLSALHYCLGAGPACGGLSGLGHGPAMALALVSSAKCDVDLLSRDNAAEAALHRVSQLGLPDVCAALLARGANPNAANGSGMRPLHLAIQGGGADAKRTRVAEQLIENAKTDPDLATPAGQTPLLMVVLQLREALVAAIIKRGADPNIADERGDTPLHAALRLLGNTAADSEKGVPLRLALALVAYARTDVNARSPEGAVPVHVAVTLASLPLVQALVARRANLDAFGDGGSAPLHRAILLDGQSGDQQAYAAIALTLIEGGADPSLADRGDASTPLHLVAGTGNAAIYRALAGRGANTNAFDKAGRTALHVAIKSAKKSGRSEFDVIACGIVETPATDVNLATRPANKTPLLLAVRGLRPAVLTALIKRRAHANTASQKGQLPLILALEMTEAGGSTAGVSHAMAKDLIDSGLPDVDTVRASDRSSPAHFAVRLAAADLLASLISRQADLGQQDARGCSVMHVAANMACCGPDGGAGLQLMRQLLSAKAPASLQDVNGCTPLHRAVCHRGGSLEAVQALVGQRQVAIAADARDAKGSTALALSIQTCGTDEQSAAMRGKDMALAIIGSGLANLNIPDADGDTPLLLAVMCCRDAGVLTALLAGGANAATRNTAQQAPLLLALELRGSVKRPARQSAWEGMALELAASSSLELNAQHAASGDTALHLAVAQQLARLVNLLLQRGADVNIKNNAGYTVAHKAIMFAAAGGDEACSLGLAVIKGGADVDIHDPDGWTCLHLVVGLEGSSRMLLSLFEAVMQRSRQLDAVTANGNAALHMATLKAAENTPGGDAGCAHVTMCQALLAGGANANLAAAGYLNRTPLHLAVAHGSPAVFHLLLAHSPTNLDAVDGGGSTPLHLALDLAAGADGGGGSAQAQARDMALALIQSGRANLHLADARQQSPLAKAVAHGLHEVVAALLAAGAPCNRVDPCSGAPPLLQATAAAVDAMLSGGGGGRDPGAVKGAVCDRVATLELLIAHSGVDVDVADGVGDTALHRLVAAGAAALAARLLERRPNLNLQNAGGDTPLHLAMKSAGSDAARRRLVLSMLRQGSARLTLQDRAGNTAMHLAFDLAGDQEIFDACAAQSPDLDIRNAQGMAPLHLAVCTGSARQSERQLGVLLQSPGKPDVDLRNGASDTPLLLAIRKRGSSAEPLAKLLLGKSASVNAADASGYTALTLALQQEAVPDSLVLLLIGARGANLDAKEPKLGDSAAAMALRAGKAELVGALLRAGAKTGVKNKEGEALIHLALASRLSDANRTRYVKMLVEHNADLNAADGAGRVPLMLLLRPTTDINAQVELAMILLDGGARPVNDLDPTSGLGWIHAGCYNVKFITKWKTCKGSLDTVADANTIFASRSRLFSAWSSPKGRVADAIFQQANSRVTAITLAALGGWKPAVSSFLDFGVSPNVGALCGAKAVTPFLVALLQGDTTMAELLRDGGALVDGEDNGINPMCMAIQVSKGLLGAGCQGYDVESVPPVVANKFVNFTKALAKDLLKDAVQEPVSDVATDAATEVAQEVFGEVAQEVMLGALDVIMPGFTLVRWGFKLARALLDDSHDESLRLSARDCMSVVQWLVGEGAGVTLNDPGMAEMIEMIVSDEDGAGWSWAGLQLVWPTSFQPMLDQGLDRIQESFEQKARQAEAQGRGTYDLEEECNEAKAKFEKSLKVAVTLDAIKKKGKGRR